MNIKQFILGPLQTNTYLLSCTQTKAAIIIDPAVCNKIISNYLEDNRLELKYILLTHGHFDHIGGVGDLALKYNPEILVHQDDLSVIQNAPANAYSLGLPAPTPFSPDNFLEHGATVTAGTIKLEVVHTPGHTPGGVCFIDANIIFAGDTLFAHSIGRTDLAGGDYEQLIASIKNNLFTLPDAMQVHPGHGPATTIQDEKLFNPFLQ